MKTYKFLIAETVVHRVTYTVRAKSANEARYKAEIGETEDEWNHDKDEVINRTIIEDVSGAA